MNESQCIAMIEFYPPFALLGTALTVLAKCHTHVSSLAVEQANHGSFKKGKDISIRETFAFSENFVSCLVLTLGGRGHEQNALDLHVSVVRMWCSLAPCRCRVKPSKHGCRHVPLCSRARVVLDSRIDSADAGVEFLLLPLLIRSQVLLGHVQPCVMRLQLHWSSRFRPS